jgi:hypothetical protein
MPFSDNILSFATKTGNWLNEFKLITKQKKNKEKK